MSFELIPDSRRLLTQDLLEVRLKFFLVHVASIHDSFRQLPI
jgi:hypothetical protein